MSYSIENFNIALKLRIDWSELDYFGHVNNVSFFKYIQAGRVNYWEKIGLIEYYKQHKIGPMLYSCKCTFLRELHYPGDIQILTKTSKVGNTSFVLHHLITNNQKDIAAEAEDVVVMFDFNKMNKIQIPDELRKSIEKVESK